ncbi:LOW QUALITY PROTEIN: putative 1-acyl-sn-glycerol-3-phosphate acyltransferase acl-1 [Cydia splendana]|uniref:LOW QUALITY PROTEIN: putative 1-acyl-sn-glycerol-3-phosphate acyltransferase acl-1 n=1 Tax=Cydia splendana TaxID=1100963 RepID=UPI00300D716B
MSLLSANILKHITKVLDIKWELRNGEILTEDRGAVIVSNHQSAFDILGLFNVWEVVGKMTAIAKKEIFYVWPFGLAAYLAVVVFIDRSNAKKSYYEQLKVTSDVMVNHKKKNWLFPEGTRNKDYTKMLPFKKGAFTMAISTQVPIIPVVFSPSPYYFINRNEYLFQKGMGLRGQLNTQRLNPRSLKLEARTDLGRASLTNHP